MPQRRDNMGGNWHTIREASRLLGISERTVRRRIKDGEIESKLENGLRFIKVDTEADKMSQVVLAEQLQKENEVLIQQLQEKDRQIEGLQKQLEAAAEASHRHDTVVMQLTKIVEYQQQPFWRKLFQRKRLPPPVVDETVMDAETGKQEKANEK